MPNIPFQTEPTIITPETPEKQHTQKDTLTPDPGMPLLAPNPDEYPNDTTPNVGSDNPEYKIPPPNSPRKNKYNLRANVPLNGKRIVLIIIR